MLPMDTESITSAGQMSPSLSPASLTAAATPYSSWVVQMNQGDRDLTTRALILDPLQLVVVDVQIGRIELAIPIELLTAVLTPRPDNNPDSITGQMVRVSWLSMAGAQRSEPVLPRVDSPESEESGRAKPKQQHQHATFIIEHTMDRESFLLQLLSHPRAVRLVESGAHKRVETQTMLTMLERYSRPTNDVFGLSRLSNTRPNHNQHQQQHQKQFSFLGLFYPNVKHFEAKSVTDNPSSNTGGAWRMAYSFHQIARVHVTSLLQGYSVHVSLDSGELFSYSFTEVNKTPSRCAVIFLAWVAYATNVNFQPKERRSRRHGGLPVMIDHLNYPHSTEFNLLSMRPRLAHVATSVGK